MATITPGWNALPRKGYCKLGYADGVATGVGGPEGEVHLGMSVQVAADEPTPVAGTHYYLMVNADGVLTQVPVAYAYDWRPAQPLEFQNLAPADIRPPIDLGTTPAAGGSIFYAAGRLRFYGTRRARAWIGPLAEIGLESCGGRFSVREILSGFRRRNQACPAQPR